MRFHTQERQDNSRTRVPRRGGAAAGDILTAPHSTITHLPRSSAWGAGPPLCATSAARPPSQGAHTGTRCAGGVPVPGLAVAQCPGQQPGHGTGTWTAVGAGTPTGSPRTRGHLVGGRAVCVRVCVRKGVGWARAWTRVDINEQQGATGAAFALAAALLVVVAEQGYVATIQAPKGDSTPRGPCRPPSTLPPLLLAPPHPVLIQSRAPAMINTISLRHTPPPCPVVAWVHRV